MAANNQVYLRVSELARRWDRSIDHIRAHIRAGNLRAVDTSVTGTKQELLIRLADVEAFELRRTVQPEAKVEVRRLPSRPKSHLRNA